MEMGTMDGTLLQDHSIQGEGTVNMTAGFKTSGARGCNSVAPFLNSRSGDDVNEGGHIATASIGQLMPSSTIVATSPATATSGMTHIVPMTWQKTKKSRSKAACTRVAEGRGLITSWFIGVISSKFKLQNLEHLQCQIKSSHSSHKS